MSLLGIRPKLKSAVKATISRLGYEIHRKDGERPDAVARVKDSDVEWLASKVTGMPGSINFAMIAPGIACNWKCFFCGTHSPTMTDEDRSDYWRGFRKDKAGLTMPLETAKRIIEDMARLKTKTLDFSGWGEPLLHKNTVPMVAYASEKGIPTVITTNGTLLSARMAEDLIAAGLKSLVISVNSLVPETYKLMHGIQDDTTLENVKRAIDYVYKKAAADGGMQVIFNNAISKYNYKEIPLLHEFASQYPRIHVNYTPYDPLATARGPFLDEAEADEVESTLIRLTGKSTFKQFWSYFARRFDRNLPCFDPHESVIVNSNGDVFPCRGCNEVMGNVNKESFYDIWLGKNYIEFRRKAMLCHTQPGVSAPSPECANCYVPAYYRKTYPPAYGLIEKFL